MQRSVRHRNHRLFPSALATVLTLCAVLLSPVFAGAASSMHEAVRDYIETHMPWPQGTARVEFADAGQDPAGSGKQATFRIEPAGNADFIGHAAFIVRIYSGKTLIRTETVRTRIEVLRDLLVTTRAIRGGELLREQDVRVVKKWVGNHMPDSLSAPEEAIGKRIVVQARPGAALSFRMLRDAPLVRKGQMVRVLFDNGSLRIATVGIPEEDGVSGNIIRIRNITSKKIIYARVLGDSLVGVGI